MEETGTQETLEAVKDSRPTTAESVGYSDNESEDFSDEEDEFDQDPAEVIREFASHPLMARAQEALEGQLKKTLDRLSTAFKEKEEHVKRIGKEREEVGVDLYGLQQQLARLQLSLENDHENLANLVDLRAQEEHVLQEVKESYKELKASKDEHTKQTQKSQVELDAINDTIRQIEEYN
jgi:chromosome segregation ATPase